MNSMEEHLIKNDSLRKIVRRILPYSLRVYVSGIILKRGKETSGLVEEIEHYYKDSHEFERERCFIRENGIKAFPYDFIKKYRSKDVKVYRDRKEKMFYVLHDGKRLYFPRDMEKAVVKRCYNALCLEQDSESPHCYRSACVDQYANGTFLDIGCAEGILALEYIDTARKVLLFECDERWIEALKHTFYPWKNKVEIITKYVGDINDNAHCTIDNCLHDVAGNVLIKIDIEGAEMKALNGAKKFLMQYKELAILCCTYHRKDDEQKISQFMKDIGLTYEFTPNYMLITFDDKYEPPYFRKGLIKAYRKG